MTPNPRCEGVMSRINGATMRMVTEELSFMAPMAPAPNSDVILVQLGIAYAFLSVGSCLGGLMAAS